MTSSHHDLATAIDGLNVLIEQSWQPLPEWMRFYLLLGVSVASWPQCDRQYVLAVSVPTRSYASTLIGAGLVLARAARAVPAELEEHVLRLRSLPLNSPVVYRNRARKMKARLLGFKTYRLGNEASELIGLQIELSTTKWVNLSEAGKIELLDHKPIRLPRRQKGYSLSPPCDLLRSLIGDALADSYVRESGLDCVLIGSLNALRSESVGIDLVRFDQSQGERQPRCGKLSDLLRVREFLPASSAHRSIAMSSSGSADINTEGLAPFACIFDGALSYLKWHRDWGLANHIAVLDRTERSYGEAVWEVNRLQGQTDQCASHVPALPRPVPGIRMMWLEV